MKSSGRSQFGGSRSPRLRRWRWLEVIDIDKDIDGYLDKAGCLIDVPGSVSLMLPHLRWCVRRVYSYVKVVEDEDFDAR